MPKPGEPRMVTIQIMRDKSDPRVFAVSLNDTRVTPVKATGCWDVLATWTVDATEIVGACMGGSDG